MAAAEHGHFQIFDSDNVGAFPPGLKTIAANLDDEDEDWGDGAGRVMAYATNGRAHRDELNGYAPGFSDRFKTAADEPIPFRQAPHNLDAEQGVLGAILYDNAALGRISSFLQARHFFEDVHEEIYSVCAELISNGKKADAVTVRPFFESAEPISPSLTVPQYLGTLVAKATANVEAYARTVHDLATRRALIIIGEKLANDACENLGAPAPDIIRWAKDILTDAEASGAGWPVPDPCVLHPVTEAPPTMPLAGFRNGLASFIETAAAAAGAPLDYVGIALIAGAAGCIGARRYVEVWPGWKEPAVIWGALVGEPSTNKTPPTEAVRDALIAVEAEKLERHKPLEEEHEAAVTKAKAAKRAWEKVVEKAVKAGEAVPPMPPEAQEPKGPIRPRTWIVNATIEKLARILAEQPGGLINFCDELAGLIGSFDRYGGDGGDRAFYLELYGGRPYRLDRVKDGSIDVPHMAVSLLGTIQPDRLNRLILSGDNDGLACRFLYAWPEPRSKKRPSAKPDPDFLSKAFKRLGSLDATGAAILPVAAPAASKFEAWWAGPHDVATRGASGMLAEAYGKMNGGVLRLALVFEFLTWATTPLRHAEPQEVSVESIEAAIDFVERWAKPMARRVFAEASVPIADRNAAVLAGYLAKERPSSINARNLRLTKKSMLPGIRNAKSMDEACSALCESGWLRPAFTRVGKVKGRKAKSYEVNPRLSEICKGPHSVSFVSSAKAVIGPKGANEATPYTRGGSD